MKHLRPLLSVKMKYAAKTRIPCLFKARTRGTRSPSRDQHRDINLPIESHLERIHGQGNIGSLFSFGLRHGEILGFDSGMEKIMVQVPVKAELLLRGVLGREKPLMPGSVNNLVAGKSLFLSADEVLKKCMQRFVPQPPQLPLMVEVPLRMREVGTVVKHPDSTD